MESLGKPIGGAADVGHTVPMDGFDQGEHGAGTGVSGGHVPSATNQQKGYGQDSSFNAGLGGEHASGGLPKHNSTPIADKFMGSSCHGTSSSDAVSGAYEGGSARDALTGESNAHTTGKGVGVLGENLHGSHSTSTHGAPTHGASSGAYDGSINRSAATGESHSHSARDAALTGTAGAASAAALGSSVSHGQGSGTGVGPSGGSGGHYSQGQTGQTGVTAGHSSSGENYNVGTGTGAGLLAGQQAGARGTHGTSGLAAGAGAAGVGAGAASSGIHSGDRIDDNNTRREPLSNPKDLDSGTRHGLVFDKATGKYVHRHELDEKK